MSESDDYHGLWFSDDIRYTAVSRPGLDKNLTIFNLATLERRDVSVKSSDAERARG